MKTTIKVLPSRRCSLLAVPLGAAADETMVKGEVTKVDPDAGKITIKHEPIKKFDMDAMTMVFKAGDEAMLKQVKPGDKSPIPSRQGQRPVHRHQDREGEIAPNFAPAASSMAAGCSRSAFYGACTERSNR